MLGGNALIPHGVVLVIASVITDVQYPRCFIQCERGEDFQNREYAPVLRCAALIIAGVCKRLLSINVRSIEFTRPECFRANSHFPGLWSMLTFLDS